MVCSLQRVEFCLQLTQLCLRATQFRSGFRFRAFMDVVRYPTSVERERFVDEISSHAFVLLLETFKNDAEDEVAEILTFLARIPHQERRNVHEFTTSSSSGERW